MTAPSPAHRVAAAPTEQHVTVTVGGVVVAETDRPVVLEETGCPTRYYIPAEDVTRRLVDTWESMSDVLTSNPPASQTI